MSHRPNCTINLSELISIPGIRRDVKRAEGKTEIKNVMISETKSMMILGGSTTTGTTRETETIVAMAVETDIKGMIVPVDNAIKQNWINSGVHVICQERKWKIKKKKNIDFAIICLHRYPTTINRYALATKTSLANLKKQISVW